MKKVKVNQDLCIGCGACQAIARDIFEINDSGLAQVKCNSVEPDLEEDVIDAAEGCPTSAICVDDDNDSN